MTFWISAETEVKPMLLQLETLQDESETVDALLASRDKLVGQILAVEKVFYDILVQSLWSVLTFDR